MKRIPVLSIFLVLAACGPAENEPGPGGVSVEDARALDEAAAKLDDEATGDEATETGAK